MPDVMVGHRIVETMNMLTLTVKQHVDYVVLAVSFF